MVNKVKEQQKTNGRKTEKAARDAEKEKSGQNSSTVGQAKHTERSCDQIVTIMNNEYILFHHSNQQ